MRYSSGHFGLVQLERIGPGGVVLSVPGLSVPLPAPDTEGSVTILKRSSLLGLLAAGGLLLSACSSNSTPTAASTTAAETTSSSASASSSSSASTSSEASSSSADDSTGASSSGAPAAELDAATETWFSTFCTTLGGVAQFTQPDTAGQSLDQEQATVVTAYTGISTAAAQAATVLESTPPPTIDSGAEIAAATTKGFQDLADVYGRGAQSIQALTPSSEADLKTAIDAVESEANAAAPKSLTDLDPGVETAVKALPACAAVLG